MPHFVQNFMANILQKLNSKILEIWGDWGLITVFGSKWAKMVYLA